MTTIYNETNRQYIWQGDSMKIDRLVSIIMVLLDKKRIGAEELADKFEVSPRTIYRDIETISMAGIPVRSIVGVGGGFEIMPGYKVDEKFFSTDELATLLIGLSSLSGMVRGEEVIQTLTKVRSVIPAEKVKDIEIRASQIHIDLNPWMGNRNIQPYLEIIKAALQQNKLLLLKYIDRHGNKTERETEPYQLVLKSRHWYLQGYCLKREDFRLFKLSRISNLEIQEEFFVSREWKKPQLEFDGVLKILQKRVKIRIQESIMDSVLEYCTYNCFLPDGEEYYFVNFPFIENDYYYSILFSFGNKCECLEPRHIREEMKKRAQDIFLIYQR